MTYILSLAQCKVPPMPINGQESHQRRNFAQSCSAVFSAESIKSVPKQRAFQEFICISYKIVLSIKKASEQKTSSSPDIKSKAGALESLFRCCRVSNIANSAISNYHLSLTRYKYYSTLFWSSLLRKRFNLLAFRSFSMQLSCLG